MIYVTQGHEKGIGIEIFLKTFLMLSKQKREEIVFVCSKNDLEVNCKDLNIDFKKILNLNLLENETYCDLSSTNSMVTALSKIQSNDILVTMPTSKDQLIYNNKKLSGHTEFFRSYFNNQSILMLFRAINHNILLITDHISLKTVPSSIKKKLILEKLEIALNEFPKYFNKLNEIIFSGLNPHAGEQGILGNEEIEIESAIEILKQKYSNVFKGPYSGDSLHFYENTLNQLFVYMYHDQGLATFKSKFGLLGLNITLGLPFIRLSVDHGTAFELYGKNKASTLGMIYLLQEAFCIQKKLSEV